MNSEATMEISSATGEADPASAPRVRSLKAARRDAIDRFEAEYVRALLQKSQGNVTRAAAMAEVSRQVIHKLITKHRLAPGRQVAVDACG